MENIYQAKDQDREANPIKDRMENLVINEGMNSPENFDCNKFEGNTVDYSPVNEERERANEFQI